MAHEELVRKAMKGDDQAYEKLFEEYAGMIYRIAFLYVKKKEDALDVVQETAYRSFKSIQSLKEPTYFKTWLTKIAIHCSLDVLRQQNKIMPVVPEELEPVVLVENEDIPLSLTLQDLLERLDANEKGVIVLRFYQGYTIQAISEILQIPLGSTKTLLYRGLQKLRKNMERGDLK